MSQDRADFLPMSEIDVDVKITDSISYMKLKQVYFNPTMVNPQEEQKGEEAKEEKPIEVSYKFPKRELDVIDGLKITLGDKTIDAQIMAKEKAQEKYEDSIAAGK